MKMEISDNALDAICNVLKCRKDDIVDIEVCKKGMTNRSFLFRIENEYNKGRYIMRIPGEGTENLIDRESEVAVYKTINGRGLCDKPVYIDAENGYKITRYLEGIRVCDSRSEEDIKKCLTKLKEFHKMKLTVSHTFDLFGQIEFYESLWGGESSCFPDYKKTKEKVMGLKSVIDCFDKDWCLTHIDAVPDNFLFYINENGEQDLQLVDWEYAGMQDPHVDIAMFCIYSLYEKSQCDRLIDIYFDNRCSLKIRTKIYCYISICGLLWSNWCEYKRNLGVEFGEYSLYQYCYAKNYYRFAKELLQCQTIV